MSSSQPRERLLRALTTLAFAAGGLGLVAPLALLVAGAVPALLLGLRPRPLAWAGLVIAALGMPGRAIARRHRPEDNTLLLL